MRFELRSQFTRELDGTGCVAVNANRFGAHIDIIAFDGSDLALPQHSQDALGCFNRIGQQRIRSSTRNKPPIGQIIAVGKNFACNLQPLRLTGTGQFCVVRAQTESTLNRPI